MWCTQLSLQELSVQTRHRKRTRQFKTNREKTKHAWHKTKTRQEIEKKETAYWVRTKQETENEIQEKVQELCV